MLRSRWVIALSLLGACRSSSGGVEGSGSDTDDGRPITESVLVDVNRQLDLLFVIDNSASTAEEQAKLAAAIGVLTDRLDEAQTSYRVGVTTTDNGNPWCMDTSPEGGKLRATSCRDRSSEFTGPDGSDALESACHAACGLDTVEIAPSAIAGDSTSRARPWIEGGAGGTNVVGATVAEALACVLPQGIDGCRYEQPLESMYKSLLRARNEEEDGYGFVRPGAVLGVVVLTDAVDCSHDREQEDIFIPWSDRHLWSDPEADEPTAAICWNAGVECDGDGSLYDDCRASQAGYLEGIKRYVETLQELEDDASETAGRPREVLFAPIAGAMLDGSIVYADAQQEASMIDFGIGPGCVSQGGAALPPVRLLEVAEAFAVEDDQPLDDPPRVYSVCADDYAVTLDQLADSLLDRMPPACVEACVADADPEMPGLQHQCELRVEAFDGTSASTEIPSCEAEESAGLCWMAQTGESLSDECRDAGSNLEVTLRHDGQSLPAGARVYADCVLAVEDECFGR